MALNLSMKILFLGALLVGLEKQLIAYYSTSPQKSLIDTVEQLTPSKSPIVTNNNVEAIEIADASLSSNVIMVWGDSKTNGHHNFDYKQFAMLRRVARSLPHKQFDDLMNQARHMSTPEFVAYVKGKEDGLHASTRMARMN